MYHFISSSLREKYKNIFWDVFFHLFFRIWHGQWSYYKNSYPNLISNEWPSYLLHTFSFGFPLMNILYSTSIVLFNISSRAICHCFMSFRILSSTRVTDKCITGFNVCLATSKPGRYTLLKRRQVNQQFKGLRKPATIIIKPGCSILNTRLLLADMDNKLLSVKECELLMLRC